MKFFESLKKAEFATKLFAAAGFNFEEAIKAGDEKALTAHVEKLVNAAKVPDAALVAKVSTLEAALESATTENKTVSAQVAALETAKAEHAASAAVLSAIGFKFPVATSGTPSAEVAATNKAALDAHIKIRAQGILAQTGHQALNEDTAGKSAAVSAKTMKRDAFLAMSNSEQLTFSKAGGQLVD